MVNSIFNWLVAWSIVLYSIYLIIHGRKINRWMWAMSAVAGMWFVVMYGLYFLDKFFIDFMDADTVRNICIKPAITVVLFALLGWIVKSGWRPR